MRGEQYFVILVHKDGTKYRVSSKPVTLKEIDSRTTRYENKRELVEEIIKNTKINLNPKDIKEVQILFQPNSKKQEYKVEKGPLYKKDLAVTNPMSVEAKFELMILDKNYAKDFVKRYKGIKNFAGIASSIEARIKNGSDYLEELTYLAEKLFSTYKGSRNIYLSIKSYEEKQKRKAFIREREFDATTPLTEEEKEEDILRYLMMHERENLDIEDFRKHSEISPFDEQRTKTR